MLQRTEALLFCFVPEGNPGRAAKDDIAGKAWLGWTNHRLQRVILKQTFMSVISKGKVRKTS